MHAMLTSQQLKELEEYAESIGIEAKELMENAGKAVYEAIKQKYSVGGHDLDGKRIIVFCGQGNNGGDGFVAARYFAEAAENFPTVILFFGEKEKLSSESYDAYMSVKNKATIIPILNREDLAKFHFQEHHQHILIDALLGIGVKGALREPISFAIDYFNSLPGIKIAVDIPSGLDPDTGEIHEKLCGVDFIVTFHDTKPGLAMRNGMNSGFTGKVVVVDIGLPAQLS